MKLVINKNLNCLNDRQGMQRRLELNLRLPIKCVPNLISVFQSVLEKSTEK